MSLPALCRSTASQAVKRNIRFSEVVACSEPSRLAWRASRLLARHTRDRAAERRADPQRFDRRPSLAERAVRRSPSPVCASSCAGMLTTGPEDLDVDDANESLTLDSDGKVTKIDKLLYSNGSNGPKRRHLYRSVVLARWRQCAPRTNALYLGSHASAWNLDQFCGFCRARGRDPQTL